VLVVVLHLFCAHYLTSKQLLQAVSRAKDAVGAQHNEQAYHGYWGDDFYSFPAPTRLSATMCASEDQDKGT
jgi:hypothetical protein